MAGYVEVSVHSFSGFRTLANASLAAVFGAWVKTPEFFFLFSFFFLFFFSFLFFYLLSSPTSK